MVNGFKAKVNESVHFYGLNAAFFKNSPRSLPDSVHKNGAAAMQDVSQSTPSIVSSSGLRGRAVFYVSKAAFRCFFPDLKAWSFPQVKIYKYPLEGGYGNVRFFSR